MFDKFQKPCCIEFYNAYDSILKNIGFHMQFFSFLKTKFDKIQSTKHAHKAVIEIFIEFIRSEVFDTQVNLAEETKRRSLLSKKIFDFCYCDFFEVSATPSDPRELNNSLFKSELKCLKLFDNVQLCLHANAFSSDDKKLLQYLIEEFIFIRAFSSFISKYKNTESIDFFKRFFFVYPFDRKNVPSEHNKEWNDNHVQKFEIVKNYINVPESELQNVREWFKEQLNKIDFAALSEENKSILVKEMFVTFGNISNEKTGDAKGFRTPLNHLFYLGRYYNVHQLPLRYVTKERPTLESIAHETWRRACKFKITPKDEIEEAKRRNTSGKMSEPSEKELYNKKAPKVDIDRLMKQFPQAVPLQQGDDYETVVTKFISSIDVSKIPDIKSAEEIPAFVSDSLSSLGINEGMINLISSLGNIEIPKINNSSEIPEHIIEVLGSLSGKGVISADYRGNIKNQKTDFLKLVGDASLSLSPKLSVQKLVGLLTHFDMYKPLQSLQEMEQIMKKTIQMLV